MKTNFSSDLDLTVTTAKAAEIVGIGYEGLRSHLKRGLLGRSGILPPLVAAHVEAPDLQNIRSKWSRFGYTDLCLMRLAKQLIGLGVDFDQANSIVSREDMRRPFKRGGGEVDAVLLVCPAEREFYLFEGDDLRYLANHVAQVGSAVVVDLGKTAAHVRLALQEIAST